ncbi:sensor histidine kinase [Actinophytocola sediminis]
MSGQATGAATGSAAARLRRLRWMLTAVVTAANMLGLVGFAWYLISDDAEQGVASVDAELHRVTTGVSRLVAFDEAVDFGLVNPDELNDRCPQFAIMPGGAPAFRSHLSQRACVSMDTSVLSGLATTAVRASTTITGYQRDADGELVRVRAEPLYSSDRTAIGAIVVVADLGPQQSQHTELVWWVVGSLVVLVGVLGAAAHVLSGRVIRPSADALGQQEVLLAETAHDLRTPVAALRSLAEGAQANPAQAPALVPRVVGLAARMGGIIDGLLVRARLAAGVERLAIQPVWLDQLVTTMVEETPVDGAQITVVAAPTMVHADPGLLARAISNLLDNAIKYGHQPGSTAVVHITVAGGTVTVADHGPGIDAAFAEETFNRFTSTGGSSGLGLSIVRWVAQAHGGRLSVYNADEGGAIFELNLPVSGS